MPKDFKKEIEGAAELSGLCVSYVDKKTLCSDMEKIIEFVSLAHAGGDKPQATRAKISTAREDTVLPCGADTSSLLPRADDDGYVCVIRTLGNKESENA